MRGFFNLVGADSFLDLPRWHEPERLAGASRMDRGQSGRASRLRIFLRSA